jgi:large conductance mechanosensitive channel
MATKKPAAKAVAMAAAKVDKKVVAAEQKALQAERRAVRAEAKIDKLKLAVNESIVHKQVRGFVDFLREQSVVGLAIGLVLGTQAKVLVDQIVASFFNPLIGLLLPGEGALNQKEFTLTIGGKTAVFGWGAFVTSLITFIIVAAVVYYVFKGLRLDKLDKKKDA